MTTLHRRALLKAFLSVPVALRFRPPVPALAPAVVLGATRWFVAGGPIERGQMVAIGADGRVYGVDPWPAWAGRARRVG